MARAPAADVDAVGFVTRVPGAAAAGRRGRARGGARRRAGAAPRDHDRHRVGRDAGAGRPRPPAPGSATSAPSKGSTGRARLVAGPRAAARRRGPRGRACRRRPPHSAPARARSRRRPGRRGGERRARRARAGPRRRRRPPAPDRRLGPGPARRRRHRAPLLRLGQASERDRLRAAPRRPRPTWSAPAPPSTASASPPTPTSPARPGRALEAVVVRVRSGRRPPHRRRCGGRVTVARVESALPATLRHGGDAGGRDALRPCSSSSLLGSRPVGDGARPRRPAGRRRSARPRPPCSPPSARAGRQLVAVRALEAAALAVAAAALAVPPGRAAHAALTHLPVVRGAGLAPAAAATAGSVAAVGGRSRCSSPALLVVPALRPQDAASGVPRTAGRGLVVRSGADVLVLALAVDRLVAAARATPGGLGHGRRAGASPRCCASPPGRCWRSAPCPLLLGGADLLARRARPLILPLAAIEAARRPQAVAAALLVVLGARRRKLRAWRSSPPGTGRSTTRATCGWAPTSRCCWPRPRRRRRGQGGGGDRRDGVGRGPAQRPRRALGRTPGVPPQLVAVDAQHAPQPCCAAGRRRHDLGRGRRPARPAPTRCTGVPSRQGAQSRPSRGRPPADAPILAAPRLVLQGAAGQRVTLDGDPVPLDGRPHRLALGAPLPAGAR